MSDAEPAPSGVDVQQALDQQEAKPANRLQRDQRQAVRDFTGGQKAGQLSMRVKVYSPFRDYYDGPAFSVSAENATGPFDILPKHHNFISLLGACDMVIRTVEHGEQTIRISGGLMHVKADYVVVFLDV